MILVNWWRVSKNGNARSVQWPQIVVSKFRASMNKTHLLLLLPVCFAALLAPAHAEKADRNKTAFIEADHLNVDDVKQINSFTGNVVLTKGTIVMRAVRIDMHEDPDGYQFGVITGVPDKPAFFRQKREGLEEFIEVEAEHIDYNGRTDVVKFTGKVLFRRLRGTVLADEVSAESMVYENLIDKYTIDGSVPGNTAPAPGQRVRAMLTPKPESTASAPSAKASAPLPKVSAPVAPTLRATNVLGSSPQ